MRGKVPPRVVEGGGVNVPTHPTRIHPWRRVLPPRRALHARYALGWSEGGVWIAAAILVALLAVSSFVLSMWTWPLV